MKYTKKIMYLIFGFFLFLCGVSEVFAAPITISGTLTGAITTWTTGNTYYVTSALTVSTSKKLIIEPGVIVKIANGATINIQGTLDVQGTASSKVVFTSVYDSTFGDSVLVGTPSPGNWGGIKFIGSGSKDSMINYAIIKYPQYGVWNYTGTKFTVLNSEISYASYFGIFNQPTASTFTIQNTLIERCNQNGILIADGSGALLGVTATNNGDTAISCANSTTSYNDCNAGVTMKAGNLTITDSSFNNNIYAGMVAYTTGKIRINNSQFNNNGKYGFQNASTANIWSETNSFSNNTVYGLYIVAGGFQIFSGNTISGNHDYAIYTSTFDVLSGVNTYSGNTYNGIYVVGDTISPSSLTIKNSGVDIVLKSGRIISKPTTVEPGVNFKIESGYLYIRAKLTVAGTSTGKVIFTSRHDNSVGFLQKGSTGTPSPGNWSALRFDSASANSSNFQNIILKYSSYGIYNQSASTLNIANSLISDNRYYGLYNLASSTLSLQDTIFQNNKYEGLYTDAGVMNLTRVTIKNSGNSSSSYCSSTAGYNDCDSGILIKGGSLFAQNCDFSSNVRSGIYSFTTGTLSVLNSTFNGNSTGIYSSNSSLTIQSNTFSGSLSYATQLSAGSVQSFSGNTFTQNKGAYVVRTSSYDVLREKNTFINNTYNGVYVAGDTIKDNSITIKNSGVDIILPASRTLPIGKTMIVEPGVVFKMISGYFNVYGKILLQGSASQKVVFTSKNDNSVGFRQSGSTGIPSKGSWSAIRLYAGSNGSSFSQAVIKYPAYGIYNYQATSFSISQTLITDTSSYGVYNYSNGVFTIDNTIIQNSKQNGLLMLGGSGSLNNVVTRFNGDITSSSCNSSISYNDCDAGIVIKGGNITLENIQSVSNKKYGIYSSTTGNVRLNNSSLLSNSGAGMYVSANTSLWMEGNTVSNNSSYGLDLTTLGTIQSFGGNTFSKNGNYPLKSSTFDVLREVNAYSQNAYNGILLTSNTIKDNAITLKDPGVDVVFSDTLSLPVGKILTIEPGMVFKFKSGDSFQIYGSLIVDGSSTDKVVFTSINDNSFGFPQLDSTGSPTKGTWGGIYIYNGSNNSRVSHAIIKYGNYGINNGGGNYTISHSLISDQSQSAIYDTTSSVFSVINNTLASNTNYGFYKSNTYTTGTFKNNIIFNNKYGVSVPTAIGTGSFSYNLFYNNTTSNFSPIAYSLTGSNNILSNPSFVDMNLFPLSAGSPAIEAGDPSLGKDEITGKERDLGYTEKHNYYYHTIVANVTNTNNREVQYTWVLQSSPPNGAPILSSNTGKVLDGKVTSKFLVKKKGDYIFDLVLTEGGIEKNRKRYTLTVQ